MKRCSTLLLLREMQIKSTVRYYFTPVRMAIIKKSTNSDGDDVEKKDYSYMVGENVNWCSYYGEQYGDSVKTKNRDTI